jgi:hypothetical protein
VNFGTAFVQVIAITFLVGAIGVFLVMTIGGVRKVNTEGVKNNKFAVPALILGIALFFGLSSVANSLRESGNNVSTAVGQHTVATPMPTNTHLQVTTNDGLVWVVDQSANTVQVFRFNKEKNEIELVATRKLVE